MVESFVNMTEGSGKKAHTFQRVIGSNTIEDEVVLIGESYFPGYRFVTSAVTSTANSHPLQIMAGSSLKVQLRHLWLYQDGLPASPTQLTFQILRLTTAGTGGGSVLGRKLDPADTIAATGMSLPTSKGTEGDILDQFIMGFVSAAPIDDRNHWEWHHTPHTKPIIIAAGTTNGIALKNTTAVAASSVTIVAEITELNF